MDEKHSYHGKMRSGVADTLITHMEHGARSSCKGATDPIEPLSCQYLAATRSVITNSHTSSSVISSIIETLGNNFKRDSNSFSRRHILKLLKDLAMGHPQFSCTILESLCSSFLSLSDRLESASESLVVLFYIVELGCDLLPNLDDRLFLSFCFSTSISELPWLLNNWKQFHVHPYVLLMVFLVFSKDPYPYIRKASLDELVGLCNCCVFEDVGMVEWGYYCVVELLQEREESVRCAAVKTVREWGQLLVKVSQEKAKQHCSNMVFLQLCSMVRDMSLEVRIEAFNALGRIQHVSEDILLHTLSKKAVRIPNSKKIHNQSTSELVEILPSNAIRVFVHGFEDEFHEVRKAACHSLRVHITYSAELSDQALNLLMDILNDDSESVRVEALETLHDMATRDCLKVLETHMHMFLGTLVDSSSLVRSTSRKVFRSVKLSVWELFRLSINGLLKNLELFPQDEGGVFSTLFLMGKNHGNFATTLMKDVHLEIEPIHEGKMNLHSARVCAFLVLFISIPLSPKSKCQNLPPRFFSYAAAVLGRICDALSDVFSQRTLLAYLSKCSKCYRSSGTEFEDEGDQSSSMLVDESASESQDLANSLPEYSPEEVEGTWRLINTMFSTVKNLWPMVQSNSTSEALSMLRACKEELTLPPDLVGFSECGSALSFGMQYLLIIQLLVNIWGRTVSRNWYDHARGNMEIVLARLDKELRELSCRFIGGSKELELYVLELKILGCVLRLCLKPEICCNLTSMKKLSAMVFHAEALFQGDSIEPSSFLVEVAKVTRQVGASECVPSFTFHFHFSGLISLFAPQLFILTRSLKHIYVELDALGGDFEHPSSFVPGLPVAIALELTLHNTGSENRLWLEITLTEDVTEFVFLDSTLFCGVGKCMLHAPFYATPKVDLFTLSVRVGMECDEVVVVSGCGGPSHLMAYLSPEKQVYFLHTARS